MTAIKMKLIKKNTYCIVSMCCALITQIIYTEIDFLSPPFTQTIGASLMDNVACIQMIYHDMIQTTSHTLTLQECADVIDALIGRFVRLHTSLAALQQKQMIGAEDVDYLHRFAKKCGDEAALMRISPDQWQALLLVIGNVLQLAV